MLELVQRMVYVSDDLADDLAVSLGEEELRVRMLEIGVLFAAKKAGVELGRHRDPARVVAMELRGKAEEGLEVLRGGHRPDGYRHNSHLMRRRLAGRDAG